MDLSLFVYIVVPLTAHGDVKIIGGRFARQGEFPHLASIQNHAGAATCGGNIISPFYVFTACHCVAQVREIHPETRKAIVMFKSWRHSRVVAGSVTRFPTEGHYSQVRWVFKWVIHDRCIESRFGIEFDFAVIQVTQPFKFNRLVKPISALAWDYKTSESMIHSFIVNQIKCNVIGWGMTERDPISYDFVNPSRNLKAIDVTIKDNYYCRVFVRLLGTRYQFNFDDPGDFHLINLSIINRDKYNNKAQMCADSVRKTDAPCMGDSGSSLVCFGKLVGVVSFGLGSCSGEFFPDFYGRIDQALDFMSKYKNASPIRKSGSSRPSLNFFIEFPVIFYVAVIFSLLKISYGVKIEN